MTRKTGSCPECGEPVLTVDPDEDRVLYGIFDSQMAEHRPGCSSYPETIPVELADL